MIIVVDYSYKKREIIYGAILVENINKIKDFLEKNKLTVDHIRYLSKKQKINIKNKWKKFLKDTNNLLLLKELTNYKFFKYEKDLIDYLKSFDSIYNIIILDDHIKINFNYAKVVYESSIYITRKDLVILVKLIDTLIYLKQEGILR